MFFWGKKKWSAGFFDGFQDLSGCASGQSLPLALSPGPHPPAWKLGEITTSSVQQTIFLRFLRLLLKFSFNFGKEVVGCRSLWGILCDSHPDPMHHSGPQLPGQWGKCWPANGESQGSKPFTRQLQQLPGWNLHIFKKKHQTCIYRLGCSPPSNFWMNRPIGLKFGQKWWDLCIAIWALTKFWDDFIFHGQKIRRFQANLDCFHQISWLPPSVGVVSSLKLRKGAKVRLPSTQGRGPASRLWASIGGFIRDLDHGLENGILEMFEKMLHSNSKLKGHQSEWGTL